MNDEIRQRPPGHSAAAARVMKPGPRWAVLFFLLSMIGLAACSSSTDPGGGDEDVVITFSPVNQGQAILLSGSLDFTVSVEPEGPLTVTWTRGGAVVGTEATYLFVPDAVGPDTLRVSATSGSESRDYYWVVTVEDDPSSIPPAVPNVAVAPGPLPTEVAVSWNRIPASTFPIRDYIVAFRLDGPVTMDNWDTSQVIGVYPVVGGQVGYSALADSTTGMPPGETVWFGVRGRDIYDQLSLWGGEHSTVVTWPWWIDGRVLLDTGETAPVGVIVQSLAPAFSDNTDGQGLFRLGPFRNIDEVVLSTTSSNANPGGWYDFVSQPLGPDERNPSLVLVGRYGLDPEYCDPPFNPAGDYLTYFRDMTFTVPNLANPKLSILHRWEEYPLAVYVPDVISPFGVDMAQAAREAFGVWNQEMGEDYFFEVGDPADADIVFIFRDFPEYAGLVELAVPPHALDDERGRVVPEKMTVTIDSGSATTLPITRGTCLHEFGHVLGLWHHASCSGIGYLMTVGGGGFLDWSQPIHPDEMNGVRTIRYLPQGVDMKDYE